MLLKNKKFRTKMRAAKVDEADPNNKREMVDEKSYMADEKSYEAVADPNNKKREMVDEKSYEAVPKKKSKKRKHDEVHALEITWVVLS